MPNQPGQEQQLSQQKANGVAGKFGHLQKDAPAKGLPTVPPQNYADVAEKAIERTRGLWRARIDMQDAESAAAAKALAAATLAQYPDAEVITLGMPERMPFFEVVKVSGPNMGTVSGADLDDLIWEDDFQDGLCSLNTDQGNMVTKRYMDIEASPESRPGATLRIADALAPAPESPSAPSDRGRRILEQYRALNHEWDGSDEDAVSGMVSDLNQWAKLNGHDLPGFPPRTKP